MSARLYVDCPECGTEIEHPAIRVRDSRDRNAFFWDVDEYPHACPKCGEFGAGSASLASLYKQTDRELREGKVYE